MRVVVVTGLEEVSSKPAFVPRGSESFQTRFIMTSIHNSDSDMEIIDTNAINDGNEDMYEDETKEREIIVPASSSENRIVSIEEPMIVDASPAFYIDKSFSYKLFRLQVLAMKNQYQMACLSTLGGEQLTSVVCMYLCRHLSIRRLSLM